MPPLTSDSSRPLLGLPSSHTQPPRLCPSLSGDPHGLRAGPIKPLSPHELTPSAGSLARLPCGSLRTPPNLRIPPPLSLHSSPALSLWPDSSPRQRLPRVAVVQYPHRCTFAFVSKSAHHTPVSACACYHSASTRHCATTARTTYPSPLPCSFGSHTLPHPAASPFPHSIHADIPAIKFLNSKITTALPSQSCRILLFFCLRLESPNSLPPPPPPDPSHLGFQTRGLLPPDDVDPECKFDSARQRAVWPPVGRRQILACDGGCLQEYLSNDSARQRAVWPPVGRRQYWRVMEDACLVPDLQFLADGDLTEMCALPRRGVYKKQRVNIARALYDDTDVVLFDDPLSAGVLASGGSSESFVQFTIPRRREHWESPLPHPNPRLRWKGLNRLLVTHALHFLSQCDYIYTLSGGRTRTAEEGTYPNLIAHGEAKESSEEGAEEQPQLQAVSDKDAKNPPGNGYPAIALTAILMRGSAVANSMFQKPFLFYQILYALLGIVQGSIHVVNGAPHGPIRRRWVSKNLDRTSLVNVFHTPMSFDTTFGKDIESTLVKVIRSVILITILEHNFIVAAVIIVCGFTYFLRFYHSSALVIEMT
ncbi:hypothetical protein B0H14DRAFT_2638975 [Mycena olivaceomarginata]|nr:hypothetical protein B0H14DRAFT_2638975 [Mycena olivaceomarginata]